MIQIPNRHSNRGASFRSSGAGMLVGAEVRHAPFDPGGVSIDRVRNEAVQQERTRLACDLHDGILQALTGARLKLKAASRLMTTNPDAARSEIEAVYHLMGVEQRELRLLLDALRPANVHGASSISQLVVELQTLRERLERLSALRVEVTVVGRGTIPRLTGDAIFRIVQESLTNVARHARAQTARVTVTIQARQVQISVADDGCGFPIRGRYNLAALTQRNQGPRSLRERVASAGGSLVLTSSPSGSLVEISLPLDEAAQTRSA